MNRTQPRSTPLKTFGLLGPFGFGNLGDAAIQQAMIQHIRQVYPESTIVGFSLNPDDTTERHGIPAFGITRAAEWQNVEQNRSPIGRVSSWLRSHPNRLLRKMERVVIRLPIELRLIIGAFRNLKTVDSLIISGGGQLDDSWGGPWGHPYVLLKYGLLAKLRGKQFVVVSVGAGPIKAHLSRIFIRGALSLADYRSYRDLESKKLIQSIGFQNDDPVYPDLAYALEVPPSPSEGKSIGTKPVVAFSPMVYCHPNFWPDKDSQRYWSYLREQAHFVLWLVEHGYQIRFFSSAIGNDECAIQDLCQILDEIGLQVGEEDVKRLEISTVDDLVTMLQASDFVVATRLHGILLSLRVGKPVLAISYHAKIDALMKDMVLSDYCLSVEDAQSDRLISKFLSLVQHRECVTEQIEKKRDEYQLALDEQFLRLFGER